MEFAIERRGGVLLVIARALEQVPGIAHAFSTRVGPDGEGFDLGSAHLPSPAIRRRRDLFLAAAGVAGTQPVVLRQVHGSEVVRAREGETGAVEGDASFWVAGDAVSPVPAVRTADCVPLLLAHVGGGAVAAVHAGWRGTAAGIASRAVERLRSDAGVRPRDLVAVLGPAILPCCYEVGPEVHAAIHGVAPSGPAPIDLHAANRRLLIASGVPPTSIHALDLCTRCRADLFFSHRREGEGAGRLMACIGPRP